MLKSRLITALILVSAHAWAAPAVEFEFLSCSLIAGQPPETNFAAKNISFFMEPGLNADEKPGKLLFDATDGRFLKPATMSDTSSNESKIDFKDTSGDANLTVTTVNNAIKGTLNRVNPPATWNYDCKATQN